MKIRRQRERSFTSLRPKEKKQCERCLQEGRPRYRVKSDCLDIRVCADCAEAARELGLWVLELKDEGTVGAS